MCSCKLLHYIRIMFSIFKKKYPAQELDLSGIQLDMHSHLLPGIDDGSPDLDTSIVLIKGLESVGLSNFITTPHIFLDYYPNNAETIGEALKKVKNVLPDSITLQAAAEYYMDEYLEKLVLEKQPLLALHQNYLLVEFSFVSLPLNWKEELFRLQINGYQPILAHPERYIYLADHKKIFDELIDMGILFQLNLLSITGYYNKTAKELAQYLLQKNHISFLGTDLHHIRHLEALRSSGSSIMPIVQELLQTGQLKNHLLLS